MYTSDIRLFSAKRLALPAFNTKSDPVMETASKAARSFFLSASNAILTTPFSFLSDSWKPKGARFMYLKVKN
jgi:hypothetical protein